ncbi:hypothetical protein PCL_08543 [Purpureocillium lilacinum]|uniref:gluconokinase n=1 Tax=Purpureocillium lilacinum TaxID=33203 RepID=A0A2U3DRG2_PURLI|nr:hypothetical protein PCL_08543 [Purpureocillium lilacinum]
MLSYDNSMPVNGVNGQDAAPSGPGQSASNRASSAAAGGRAQKHHHIWLVTGPAGCGKTTVAEYLAGALDVPYIEGDSVRRPSLAGDTCVTTRFHTEANIEKMRSGVPLTDADRWDWLTALRDESMGRLNRGSEGVVVTCSALKRKYRDVIRVAAYYDHDILVHFIFLSASPDVLLERVSNRKGHYMGANMVKSQFDILEPPAQDERDVFSIDGGSSGPRVSRPGGRTMGRPGEAREGEIHYTTPQFPSLDPVSGHHVVDTRRQRLASRTNREDGGRASPPLQLVGADARDATVGYHVVLHSSGTTYCTTYRTAHVALVVIQSQDDLHAQKHPALGKPMMARACPGASTCVAQRSGGATAMCMRKRPPACRACSKGKYDGHDVQPATPHVTRAVFSAQRLGVALVVDVLHHHHERIWMGGMGWDGGGHASLPVDNIIGKGEDDDVDDAQFRCVSTHNQAPLGEAHRVLRGGKKEKRASPQPPDVRLTTDRSLCRGAETPEPELSNIIQYPSAVSPSGTGARAGVLVVLVLLFAGMRVLPRGESGPVRERLGG